MEPISVPQKKKRLRLIDDVRIGFGPRPELGILPLQQLGYRYATLLAEQYEYKLSSCNCFNLYPFDSVAPGNFKLLGVSDGIYVVHVGLDKTRLDADSKTYTTNLIAEVLKAIAETEGGDPRPIELARQALIKDGNDTKIYLSKKTVTIKGYRIEPFMKIKGPGVYFALSYTELTHLASGKSGCRLIAQATVDEIREIGRRFLIQDEAVVLKPRLSHTTERYRQRGFNVFIKVPLNLFF